MRNSLAITVLNGDLWHSARSVRFWRGKFRSFSTGGEINSQVVSHPLSSACKNFYSLSLDELSQSIKPFPTYRSEQIRAWVYGKGVTDFAQMNNLPLELRENLKRHISFGTLSLTVEQVSKKDGTIKRAYQLPGGQLIESVLMPYEDGRRTACISSQAGCAMGCVFCATGQMVSLGASNHLPPSVENAHPVIIVHVLQGFSRQLSSSEIFEQAARFAVELRARNERLSNIVLMGMGEPLNNYKSVMHAVERIRKELGIGARHITLSTVGVVPKIKRLADENIQASDSVLVQHSTFN